MFLYNNLTYDENIMTSIFDNTNSISMAFRSKLDLRRATREETINFFSSALRILMSIDHRAYEKKKIRN